MTPAPQVHQFLYKFAKWASSQPDIQAVALVGSYARDKASDASDVDLVIVTGKPETYLRHRQWAQRFGTIKREQFEDYGKVSALRVCYSSGHEVEYGFTDETWPALPLDEGTNRVISSGMQILFERGSMLSRLRIQKPMSLADRS